MKYLKHRRDQLNAQPWQINLLRTNPEYCGWWDHNDRTIVNTWNEFESWVISEVGNCPFKLAGLQCVRFCFDVIRQEDKCNMCDGNGYHQEAQEVVNTFYKNKDGEGWDNNITQDEVQALVDAGQLKNWTHDFDDRYGWRKKSTEHTPTAHEVNEYAVKFSEQNNGWSIHGPIERCILIKTRLNRLGIPLDCENCVGRGEFFTDPAAHVSLVLWLLNPRKGRSHGVEITRIERDDLPAVQEFLKLSAHRNANYFSGVSLINE